MFDLDGPQPDPEPPPPICFLIDPTHYECKLCTCSPSDQFSCYQFQRVVPEADATARQLFDRSLDCTERRRRIRESLLNINIHSRQELDWLVDAARVSKLVAEGNADLAPVFWIRLYGILHEIYERLFASNTFAVQNGATPTASIAEFLGAIEQVASLFSDDERIYIQYRRDVECHPLQLNYEFQVNKSGGTRERFHHKLLAKTVPVSLEEFSSATKRVLATVRHEIDLARVFAGRCWLALAGLRRKGARIYG
jgi:hypothetical protein